MDKNIELSYKIFLDIIDKGLPFALALRNNFKKVGVDKDLSGDIKSLVGCSLRHYILFTEIIKEDFGDLTFDVAAPLYFVLANRLFLKRLDQQKVDDFAKSKLIEADLDLTLFTDFINKHTDEKDLIPSKYLHGSNEFLSFRFNTPLWVVRMLTKQNGNQTALKVLKANYTPAKTTCRVNTLVVSKEDILKDPDFKPTCVDSIVTYVGRAPLMKTKFFTEKGLFFEKVATKKIIDMLDIEPIKRIAIYSALPNNIYLELAALFGKNVELDIINGHTQSYFEMKKEIEKNGMTNVRLYDETYKSLYTCLSYPVNTFFVLPRNTMLDLLRSTPDYFLKLKQDKLDGILLEQKETLENAARCLDSDGRIIYMIPTISNKEGKLMIESFLNEHPEFVLESQRQFYPFEEEDSCLYYAIIRKVRQDD